MRQSAVKYVIRDRDTIKDRLAGNDQPQPRNAAGSAVLWWKLPPRYLGALGALSLYGPTGTLTPCLHATQA